MNWTFSFFLKEERLLELPLPGLFFFFTGWTHCAGHSKWDFLQYCVTSLSVSVCAVQRQGGLWGKTLFLSSSSFIRKYVWSVFVKTPPPPPFPSLCNTIIRVGVWIPVHADARLHLSGGGSQYISKLFQRFKVCCNIFLQHMKQLSWILS